MTISDAELQKILAQNPHIRIRENSRQGGAQAHTAALLHRGDFDSDAEYRYYQKRVVPGMISGHIVDVKIHKGFEVVEAVEYKGNRYKNRIYTPDFIISYRDGSVDVVEVKNPKVKKLQRDYPIRRQLFIIKYCKPNNWLFLEVKDNEI